MNKGFVVFGPGEMGVKIKRGRPVKFIDSGYHWVGMLPGSGVERYSKEWYNLDFSATQVYTGEKEIEGVTYQPKAVIVNAVAYIQFPQNKNLVNIIQVKVPREENELKTWIKPSVIGALRVILGKFSYRELFHNLDQIRKKVDEKFKETVISRAGFERNNLVLTIEEIKLPSDLEKELSRVDVARLEAKSASYLAEKKGIEAIGPLLECMSQVYGITVEELQQKINNSPELKKLVQDTSIELLKREQAKEGGVLLHLYRERMEGNKKSSSIEETLENFFVELLELIKSERIEKKKEDLSKKKTEELTREERKKELKEIYGEKLKIKR